MKIIKDKNFVKWMIDKRDIDGLIIAFLISSSISKVVNSFVDGLVEPFLNAFFILDSDYTHDVYITNRLSRFKLNMFISNCIKFVVNCLIAYILFRMFNE